MTTHLKLAASYPSLAAERVAESRALLRQALEGSSAHSDDSDGDGIPNSPPAWLDKLRSLPVVGILGDALGTWWARHPLRLAGGFAADISKVVIQPLARSNPLGLVLGALLLGGLVVWSRPWRWIAKPALFAGLATQLISQGIARLPIQSWMVSLASSPQKRRGPPASGSAAGTAARRPARSV